VGASRIIAVLEPRSNTMKMGIWRDSLAGSLAAADLVFCYAANLGWNAGEALASLGQKVQTHESLEELIAAIAGTAQAGDQVLIMSNGGFGGIHEKLLRSLSMKPISVA
jgi:UDP-N-acetylmuramate: L-alanyl-gamma-D-glutamyl-meso-diaminopimelate ligase